MVLLSLDNTIPFFTLFCAPGNSAFIEVVYGNLNGHVVTRQYFNIIHSQLSRYMSRYYMLIGKLDFEDCVWQRLDNSTFKFYDIVFWQKNPSNQIFELFAIFLKSLNIIFIEASVNIEHADPPRF